MGANGVVMLAAGRWWYGAVAGVPETGPFNPHFVKDIGAAYLVVGAAFAWLAARAIAGGARRCGWPPLRSSACTPPSTSPRPPARPAGARRPRPRLSWRLPAGAARRLAVATAYQPRETRHAQSPA